MNYYYLFDSLFLIIFIYVGSSNKTLFDRGK